MRKVSPGEELRIKAADYNAFVDAARYVESQQHSLKAGAALANTTGTIRVLNTEGIAVPRFGLLWLVGMEGEGLYIARRPAHPFLCQLAIAAIPIEPGRIGRAWVDGIRPLLSYDVESLRFPSTAISQSYSYFARRHSAGNVRLLSRFVSNRENCAPLVMACLQQAGGL